MDWRFPMSNFYSSALLRDGELEVEGSLKVWRPWRFGVGE
jgi:hypothetical protein